jgi:hypothetical protein
MMRLCLFCLAGLVLIPVLALEPRKSSSQYPARVTSDGFEIGARRLPVDDVSRLFSPSVNQGYIVVEVAVFPVTGQPVSVNPDDFTLRIDGSRLVKPVEARAVLAAVPLTAAAPAKPAAKKSRARPKKPPASAADTLSADAFKTTSSSTPFAGYLYFPVAGQSGSRFELEHYGMRRLRLPL